MNPNFSALLNKLQNGVNKEQNQPILFCGAGISIASGIPSAKAINEVIKDKSYLEKFNSSPNRKMIFWRSLMTDYCYNESHYSALSLLDKSFISTIITSNYDCLFEQCISTKFRDWKQSDDDCGIKKDYNKKILIKIHGDIFQDNVKDINILTLAVGKKTHGSSKVWQDIFHKDSPRDLWVIGYSGKNEDAAYKYIQESVQKGNIKDVYWMHCEKESINHILPNHTDKVHFIPIKDANEAFEKVRQHIPFPRFNETVKKQARGEGLEKVRESFRTADITLDLLKELDKDIVTTIEEAEQKFDDLLEPGECLDQFSKLTVLRRFNSYTPILAKGTPPPETHENNEDISKGGGYFLVYKGHGVVIDPGYDFIENYVNHEYEPGKTFSLNHIDTVIITHAHNDHYGELDSLQNLIYQFNNRLKTRKRLIPLIERSLSIYKEPGFNHEKNRLIDMIKSIITDRPQFKPGLFAIKALEEGYNTQNSVITFLEKQISESNKGFLNVKKLKLFASKSAMKSIDGLLPIDKSCFDDIQILNSGNKFKLTDSITVTATKAKHIDLYSKQHSIGLKFSLKADENESVVGFTGDTGYFNELPNIFKDCDILIPHLGSIKPKELDIYRDKFDKNSLNINLQKDYIIPKLDKSQKNVFYENHLGIIGLTTLLSSITGRSNSKLKKIIISEYGEEIKNYRNKISILLENLLNRYGSSVEVHTGDIGTTVDLP